jgi:hypothetical protein
MHKRISIKSHEKNELTKIIIKENNNNNKGEGFRYEQKE